MKLDRDPAREYLAALGAEAVGMLCRGEVAELARRYGYALAYGRDLATAIQDDLRHCLAEAGGTRLIGPSENPVQAVRLFEPNDSNLVAVVECLAPVDSGASVLVELIATRSSAETHITLEDISVVASDTTEAAKAQGSPDGGRRERRRRRRRWS